MAQAKKKATIKLKDINGCAIIGNPNPYEPRNEFDEFYALLFNAFKIVDKSGNDIKYIVARRIKELILNSSIVGYDKMLDLWAQITPSGERNLLNLPIRCNLILPTGKTIPRELRYEPAEDGTYLIYTMPGGLAYSDIIKQHTDIMFECDIAIAQNLRATKSPFFIVCTNENYRLSLEHAIQQQQQGSPVIVVSSDIYESFKGIPLDTPIVFDKIYEFRQKVRDNLLTKLSTLTSNKDKKERVQSAEVTAGVGECEDYIYALIDNCNQQFETYDLNFKLITNSSLEELYTPNTTTDTELINND